MDEKQPNFEEAMLKLEEIVNELENGDVPLEQAIELFQEGIGLSGYCNQKLEQAERKIERLLEKDGVLETVDYEPPVDEKGDLA